MAFPIAAVLAAAATIGGIVKGADGRPTIDPEVLKKFFGPEAITEETMQMFNSYINSPAGQQIMNNAATSGASFGNELRSQLGKAGFEGGDVNSPMASFTRAAGDEAANSMQREAKGNAYNASLGAVTQNMGQRMGAWTGSQNIQQQQPTFGQQMGSALLGAAGSIASQIPTGPKPTAQTGTIAPAGGAGAATLTPGYFGAAGTNYRARRGLGRIGLGARANG